MNNSAKIRAKELLYQNTLRLFIISLASFLLRWCALGLIFSAPYFYLKAPFYSQLCDLTGTLTGSIISVALFSLLTFGLLCLICSIKAGEHWIYVQRLNNLKPRLRFIFKFLSPRTSIKLFALYTKMLLLKVTWLIYFMIPPVMCLGCAFYLISRGADVLTATIPAAAGAVLLSAVVVLIQGVFSRYSQCTFYMVSRRGAAPRDAFAYSLSATDGRLNERTVFLFSLTGWVLSCILIIPIVYTVPYLKLCSVTLAEEYRRMPLCQTEYAVNILEITQAYTPAPQGAAHLPPPPQAEL